MARAKVWSESAIERMHIDGRGKGTGASYQPWINVQDVSSLGCSRRIFGIKTHREHHLLSNVEWNSFLLLEFTTEIIDIREQFPLERDLTLEIAAALGIRHPHYVGTRIPTVMTVDFLVTRQRGKQKTLEAFNCKRVEEAENETSLEKLEIQRAYFDGAGIAHHLILHSQLPMQKVKNIEWIRNAHLKPGENEPYPGFYDEYAIRIANELRKATQSCTLTEFCSAYDARSGFESGTALRITRMLMQTKVLIPDLNNPNLATAPLASFVCSAPAGQLYVTGGY